VENYGYSKSEIESALKIICNIEDITKKLDCEPFSIEKLKEYNNIKKKKTKKFLNALGKI
jgi:Zn-finger domain-containing protein